MKLRDFCFLVFCGVMLPMTRKQKRNSSWIVSSSLIVLILALWVGSYIGLRKADLWRILSGNDFLIEIPHCLPLEAGEVFRPLLALDFYYTGKKTQIVRKRQFHIGATAKF